MLEFRRRDMGCSISKLDKDRARFYSSLLSRSFFERMLSEGNAVGLRKRIERYDDELANQNISISEYLRIAYRYLSAKYQNEYVYKNTLIRKLIHSCSNKDTVIFSEFKVGRSYADLVMFNGESRVYEIKTELDTQARLASQLKDYKGLFQKIYIVTHEKLVDKYSELDKEVGIISLTYKTGRITLTTVREPVANRSVDVHTLMKTLHTNEYKTLVKNLYGRLPEVSNFQMYKACTEALLKETGIRLQEEVNNIIKKRKSVTPYLKKYEKRSSCLIQLCLSLHIVPKEYEKLHKVLQQSIF